MYNPFNKQKDNTTTETVVTGLNGLGIGATAGFIGAEPFMKLQTPLVKK